MMFRRRFTVAVLGVVFATRAIAVESSTLDAIALAQEGATALAADDPANAVAKLEAAADLRPDFPRVLEQLAIAQTAADQADAAIATLNRIANMGLGLSVSLASAPEFVGLREHESYRALVKQFAANLRPTGSGEVAFTLRGVTGLLAGIAWREKTGEFFFGDVNDRAVWVRNKDGTLRRFSPEGDELLGVLAIAVDENTGTLWAATSAVSEMLGFSPDLEGSAALVALDLESGAVRASIPVPRNASADQPPRLTQIALAPDGSVLIADAGSGTIWRLASGGEALEPLTRNEEFLQLRGVAVLPNGIAIASDHLGGLFRVDLGEGSVAALAPPDDTTLVGIDGVTATANGHVIAVQNGVRPVRVLRVEFDAAVESVTSVSALDSGHLTLSAPSLGCIATGGNFFFVANPGWNRFEASDGAPTAPRAVAVFKSVLR